MNIFGGIHRGFTPPSSGTLNVVSFGSDVEDGGLDVEAEKSWNLEAGLRTSGSLITTEISGFYLRIEDLVAAGRGTAFRNLGMARTYGVELASSLRPLATEHSPVAHVSYTYLQTEVLDGRIQSAVVNNVPRIYSGMSPYAPRHNVTLAVTQQMVEQDPRRTTAMWVMSLLTLKISISQLDEVTRACPCVLRYGQSLMPIGSALAAQVTVKNALDEIYIGSRCTQSAADSCESKLGILPGARRQVNEPALQSKFCLSETSTKTLNVMSTVLLTLNGCDRRWVVAKRPHAPMVAPAPTPDPDPPPPHH